MGPEFGPGFIQEYTNAIRRFGIADDGTQLSLVDFEEILDTVNLHRRDYNLVPQIFPSGEQGFTAFSGVFQYGNNIPWLNAVDITAGGYSVIPVFEQLLNQYHTAHLPAYSGSSNTMNTVFFGGIARYFLSGNGDLVDDTNVPFVNTISRVQRASNGAMEETAIGNMAALLGSSAEFILNANVPNAMGAIIDLDALEGDTVLAGHIVGGIESSAPNIFFINTGTQSDATTRVFRVLLVADSQTGIQAPTGAGITLDASIPVGGKELIVTLAIAEGGTIELDLVDMNGRIVQQLLHARVPGGEQRLVFQVKDLAVGPYLVSLRKGEERVSVRVVR